MPPTKTIFLAFTHNKSSYGLYYQAIAHEMSNRGYKVIIISDGQRTHKVSIQTNPSVVTWPSYRPIKYRDAIFLSRLIRKYQPVLILANFGAVNICVLVAWILKVSIRIAAFRTSDNIKFLYGKNRIIAYYEILRKRIVYQFTTHMTTVAKAMVRELNEIYKVPLEKISYFYNAQNDPQIEISQSMKASKKLICVAGLTYGKGQDILLHALPDIIANYPSVKVDLIGMGEWKVYLESLINELDLVQNVSLLGQMPHKEVITKISESSILILPTRYDACPNVIIEAMSVGTPVIASDVGGIPEIIRDGIDGFLVPPNEPQALAQRIIKLLSDSDLRRTMGSQARNRFLDKFELKQAIKKQADWLENKIIQLNGAGS